MNLDNFIVRPKRKFVETYSEPEAAALPAQPPKFPLKFFGYGIDSKVARTSAFLTDGNAVYIVAEGETVLGRFRILKISSANPEFEEIASGKRASASLQEQAPAS